MKVRVVDSTADYRWMVLPLRPAGTEGWSEEQLAAIVREGDMIGVTSPGAGTVDGVARCTAPPDTAAGAWSR